MNLEEKLKNLPDSPGVYLMYDQYGQVIYVGKARILKNRVRQYFNSTPKPPKVQAMVENIFDFGYILTLTEKDAFSLEANLIRQYNPRYNILLKDDKHSPYIKIDLKEEFPTIEITRKIKKDGARYFGPYFCGIKVLDIVEIIRSVYKMRACPKKFPKRECLHYHIDMCCAPCTNKIDKAHYRKIVNKVISFLSGRDDEAEQILKNKMQAAVENEQFERAIDYREKLKMLQLLKERTIASSEIRNDMDSIAYVSDGKYGAIAVNIIRGQKMMGVKNYSVTDAGLDTQQTLTSFLTQYYSLNNQLPQEILLNTEIETDALKEFLSAIRGGAVKISFPKKGKKKMIIDMAVKNATEYLNVSIEKILRKNELTIGATERLREILGLKVLRKIECYDISNISGVDKVASGVVFFDGEPLKSEYRRYRIKAVIGSDDYASIREVIKRRLSSDRPLPDLFVIDGGKGQLSAAMEAMQELKKFAPIISLAKKEEWIFMPNQKEPLVLDKSDIALRLLQRVRDEAHRFAITYHRTLRSRRMDSELLSIKGVGPKKREKLLKSLTFKEIKTLSAEEISKKSGIDLNTAKNIEQYYKEQTEKDE